jgi:uncharacterized membrane protein (GlpM family)
LKKPQLVKAAAKQTKLFRKLRRDLAVQHVFWLSVYPRIAATMQYVLRFLIGGTVVCLFAGLGDALKPKSFAGLFSAAPSIALASLGLVALKDGKIFAAIESRSMLVGAVAFFIYSLVCCRLMIRQRFHAAPVTIITLAVWLVVALAGWTVLLRS